MKSHADIRALAAERFQDAVCLETSGRYDAAYYLAGYTVELLIKAKVCKTLGIEDFFDFENPNKSKLKNEGSLNRAFKVHDLEQLLILSGIYTNFKNHLIADNDFRTSWSVIEKWNENTRYSVGKIQKDVEDLLTSIKKFEIWILNYL